MFAFLSKKLALSHDTLVHSLAWHQMNDGLAVGGGQGLQRIIKLDDSHNPNQSKAEKGSDLLKNLSLMGDHKSEITILNWNERYKKLLSCDSNGLMIIWTPSGETWAAEMVNDSGKKLISDVKWSADGTKLCILIDDGQCIVGSVDGEKLWAKNIEKVPFLVEWSPDGKYLLIGTNEGEVIVYENNGNFLYSMKIMCLANIVEEEAPTIPNEELASIEWYRGAKMNTEDTPASLIIGYRCGRIQLVKNESDINPILIDCGITISRVAWNPRGTIFAVSGQLENNTESIGVVQFYNNYGNYLKTLKTIVSTPVGPITWQGTGLKISLGVGSAMYLANIKQEYKFGYMSKTDTQVFAVEKEDRIDFCVVFYDCKKKTRRMKFIRQLYSIKCNAEFAIIISKIEETEEMFKVVLCNSIGNPIETKQVVSSIKPRTINSF